MQMMMQGKSWTNGTLKKKKKKLLNPILDAEHRQKNLPEII